MNGDAADNHVSILVADATPTSPSKVDLWVTTLPAVIAIFGSLFILLISNSLQRKLQLEQTERARRFKALEDITQAASDCARDTTTACLPTLAAQQYLQATLAVANTRLGDLVHSSS